MYRLIIALCLVFGLASQAAIAEEANVRNGSDTFIGGDTILIELDSSGDTFVGGQAATLGGTSLGDLHVSGFDVSVRTDVAQDLYAAGATVEIRGAVSGDTSAMGFTVRTLSSSKTIGNTRLAGNTVTIEGPVQGALSVLGRSVILNAPIQGDVLITAKTLAFGENAKIEGRLSYSTEARVTVPESVISADRVTYSKLEIGRNWRDFRNDWPIGEMPGFPGTATVFGAFLLLLLFFMLLGALALAFVPDKVERMRLGIAAAPGRSMLLGVIGLSMLFGLVPITALTIIGLPFLPFFLLAIVVVWTLGYALGGYAIAMYLWRALGGSEDPNTIIRVLLIAGAVTVVALLNFIPFVGWAANYALVLIGIGAITRSTFAYFVTSPGPALDVDMKATKS